MNLFDNLDLEQLQKTIEKNKSFFIEHDINQVNHNGSSLLAVTAFYGNLSLVNKLIELGIDGNIINNNGYSAASFASSDEIFDIVINSCINKEKILLSIINDVNSYVYDNIGRFNNLLKVFKEQIINLDKSSLSNFVINIHSRIKSNTAMIDSWNSFTQENNLEHSQLNAIFYIINNLDKTNPYLIKNSIDKTSFQYENEFQSLKNITKNYFHDLERTIKTKDKVQVRFFLQNTKINKHNRITMFLSKRETDIQKNLNQEEIQTLFNIINHLKRSDITQDGQPLYLLTEELNSHLVRKWQKTFFNNLSDKNLDEYKKLIKQYNLAGLKIDTSYKFETVIKIIKDSLGLISNVFNIDAEQVGVNRLNIELIPKEDNNDDYIGAYFPKSEKFVINCENIFRKKEKDFNVKDFTIIENFKSIFLHEYTHFLQYIGKKNMIEVNNLFENFAEVWNEIITEIKNIQYTKEEYKHFLISEIYSIKKNLIDSDKILLNEYIDEYISNSKDKSIEHYIEKITHLLGINIEKNIDIINYIESLFNIIDSTIHQNNESFHFVAWKNLDKNSKKPYYQRADEIHARLVEEVLYNREDILTPQSICQVDCIKSNKDIKKSIKIKLEKFNALILSNNELFNIPNFTQDKNITKLTS